MARNRRRAWRFEGSGALEERLLMAAPVVDPISNLTIPVLKTRIVPLTGSDADGDPLTYTVQSDNAAVTGRIITNTVDLKLTVANFGDMTIKLIPEFAPNTVQQISDLVRNGFYNGLTFHRIIAGFMIQGGDPQGTGHGGPGFKFDDEFNSQAIFSGVGQMAMANSGPDTNGSQFFITVAPQRSLDFGYNLYGQLVRGFDVLNAINAVPTNPDDFPLSTVTITSATIVEDKTDAVLVLQSTASGSAQITVTATDPGGEHGSKTFTASSAADSQNDPPFLGPVPKVVTTAVGKSTSVTLTSTDLENNPVTYAAVVDSATQNGTVSVVGNVVTVTPNPGFVGDIPIKVGVRQSISPTRFDTQVFTVTVKAQVVTAQPLNPSAVAGSTTTVKLANFTTTVPYPASNYTAVVTWEDNSTSNADVIAGANGSFDVSLSVNRATVGSFPYSVKITDATTGVEGTANGTLTTSNAPLSVQFVPTAPAPGTRAVSGILATLVDGNPSRPSSELSVVIDWGDLSTSAGTLVAKGNGAYDITGSHTYAALGTYTVKVTVQDQNQGSSSTQGSVVVPNLAPVLDAIADKNVNEGSTLTFTVHATDTDSGQTVVYTLGDGAPAGATLDPATGEFSWTPASGPQTIQITVIASDDGSPVATDSKTFTIQVANVLPVIDAGPTGSLNQGGTYTGSGSFTDPGIGPWTATVDYGDGSGSQPLTLNPDKTFTLSHKYDTAGNFSIVVSVVDSAAPGQPSTKSVAVTVAGVAPVVTAGPAGDILEGQTYTGSGSFTAAGQGPWTATVDYGDGSGVQPLTLEGDKTFALSHLYSQPGDFTVTISIVDADFQDFPGTTTVAVKATSLTPVVTAGPNGSLVEGGTYTGSGSFTNPGDGPWTATVDYGDGSGVQNLALNPDKTFALSHRYAAIGNYTINVVVTNTDLPGRPGSTTVPVTVLNSIPVVTLNPPAGVNEGSVFTGGGSFTAPGDGPWSGSVDYGDGTGVQDLALLADKTFVLSHRYESAGDRTVTVRIINNAFPDRPGIKTMVVKVANVTPVVSGGPASTIKIMDTYVGSGSFADPGKNTWTATVDYGDGSGKKPLTLNADKTFALSHQYQAVGNYNIVIEVKDGGASGQTGTKTIPVRVDNVAPTVSAGVDGASPISAAFIRNGAFSDLGAGTWTATVDYGDGTGVLPLALGTDKSFTLTHFYHKYGVFKATVTVTDQFGASGVSTFNVEVPLPPQVSITQGWMTKNRAGAVTSISLRASSPLDFKSAAKPANYTVVRAGRDGLFGTKDDVVVYRFRVASVLGDVVTLLPIGRPKYGASHRLRIVGLVDNHGRPLKNAANGALIGTFTRGGGIVFPS